MTVLGAVEGSAPQEPDGVPGRERVVAHVLTRSNPIQSTPARKVLREPGVPQPAWIGLDLRFSQGERLNGP